MHAFRSYIFAARIACDSGPTCLCLIWICATFWRYTVYIYINLGPIWDETKSHTPTISVGEVHSVDFCWTTKIDRPPWIKLCVRTSTFSPLIRTTTAVIGPNVLDGCQRCHWERCFEMPACSALRCKLSVMTSLDTTILQQNFTE